MGSLIDATSRPQSETLACCSAPVKTSDDSTATAKRDATFADIFRLRDLISKRSSVAAAIQRADDPDILEVLDTELESLTNEIDLLDQTVAWPPKLQAARDAAKGKVIS